MPAGAAATALVDRRSVGRGSGRSRRETGIITAGIDPARIAKARGMVPSLQHDRGFTPRRWLARLPPSSLVCRWRTIVIALVDDAVGGESQLTRQLTGAALGFVLGLGDEGLGWPIVALLSSSRRESVARKPSVASWIVNLTNTPGLSGLG